MSHRRGTGLKRQSLLISKDVDLTNTATEIHKQISIGEVFKHTARRGNKRTDLRYRGLEIVLTAMDIVIQ